MLLRAVVRSSVRATFPRAFSLERRCSAPGGDGCCTCSAVDTAKLGDAQEALREEGGEGGRTLGMQEGRYMSLYEDLFAEKKNAAVLKFVVGKLKMMQDTSSSSLTKMSPCF